MRHRVWGWAATLYLVWLPCLWWQGLSPDQAQTEGWYVATAGLLGLSLCTPSARGIVIPWEVGTLWLGAVLTSLWHLQANGLLTLLLQGVFAWVALWSLLRGVPSWQWLAQRIRWLAWLNIAYWLVEMMGYDPLFTVAAPAGLFSRQNHLAILLAIAFPLSGRWERLLYGLVVLKLGNLTALTLMGVWGIWTLRRAERLIPTWVGVVSLLVGEGVWMLHAPVFWQMKVVPRLLVWKAMLSQCLMLPGLLVGYGMGAWNHLTPYPRDPYGYSVYLDIWHASGVLVLGLLLWTGWRLLWGLPPMVKASVLALAGVGLTQDVWNWTRLIILSLAVVAMVLIGRADADTRQGNLPQIP